MGAVRRILGEFEVLKRLEELADSFAQDAWRLLRARGAVGASVTVHEDGYLTYVAAVGAACAIEGRIVAVEDSSTGRVIVENQSTLFPAPDSTKASLRRAASAGFTAGIVVPVRVGGQAVGTLGVVAVAQGTSFASYDVSALESLASLLSTRITDGG